MADEFRKGRERCGTVEKVRDVLKDDLAGVVLPSKRLFANAAWRRLNAMTPEAERPEDSGMLSGSLEV